MPWVKFHFSFLIVVRTCEIYSLAKTVSTVLFTVGTVLDGALGRSRLGSPTLPLRDDHPLPQALAAAILCSASLTLTFLESTSK